MLARVECIVCVCAVRCLFVWLCARVHLNKYADRPRYGKHSRSVWMCRLCARVGVLRISAPQSNLSAETLCWLCYRFKLCVRSTCGLTYLTHTHTYTITAHKIILIISEYMHAYVNTYKHIYTWWLINYRADVRILSGESWLSLLLSS